MDTYNDEQLDGEIEDMKLKFIVASEVAFQESQDIIDELEARVKALEEQVEFLERQQGKK